MKHYIDAQPGSSEFRQKFREIRDDFLRSLDRHTEGKSVLAYRACDIEGNLIKWVWDETQFKNAHLVGSLDDAKAFITNMIDEGMCFAFLGAKANDGIDVWLTTWEAPEEGPRWPKGLAHVFEEIHGGVSIKRSQ